MNLVLESTPMTTCGIGMFILVGSINSLWNDNMRQNNEAAHDECADV